MSGEQTVHEASTPQASAAQAQSRDPGADNGHRGHRGHEEDRSRQVEAALNRRFRIAPSVTRPVPTPYVRLPDDPLYRPLSILTTDPTASRLEGSIARINVPYEPLEPGPAGRLFKVDVHDYGQGVSYRKADLDDVKALLKGGYDPSPSDPRFHEQMVYAVCSSVYASFRNALGRHMSWGFTRRDQDHALHLRPFAFRGANAYYDKWAGCICFGYAPMPACPQAVRALPGETVFACLSHDVIAHEVTHALLDGLRANFSIPTGPDVPGFHEGFADLVAIFQRMSCKEVVNVAIRKSRGMLDESRLLTGLAQQLALANGKQVMRDAMAVDSRQVYDPEAEAHDIGSILAGAVFEAFLTVFRRKTARYLRLASHGSGVVPPGELAYDLAEILSDTASKLASHFLALIIRAIDYCPPVDIHLGEYLRALVTADHDLVPDDPWAYREALIDAFMKRRIYPKNVTTLSEQALLWRPPRRKLPPIVELDFAHLRFNGDPGCLASAAELERQAAVLGEYATRPEHLHEFGLVADGAPELDGATAELPQVASIRASRRVGPDRQIVFDLVAEVTQRCIVPARGGTPAYPVFGGSTVILGPDGAIRYVVSKNAAGDGRLARRLAFMASPAGRRYWSVAGNRYTMEKSMFQSLH
ncbi:hypothetical protein [Massilia consociata]|uniref:Peptidase M4 n=1 Tax=Massilia consociata TaxID=760117 RepID=A0ABV6FA61_9BURK